MDYTIDTSKALPTLNPDLLMQRKSSLGASSPERLQNRIASPQQQQSSNSYQQQFFSQQSHNSFQQKPASPGPDEKTYLARRLSRQVTIPSPSPTNLSLPRTITPVLPEPFPLSNPPQAVESQNDINAKSKEEVLKMYHKLAAEVNIKNKIILDLKTKENWLTVQLNAKKAADGAPAQDIDLEMENTADSEKKKVFDALILFKKELAKAKATVEENNIALRNNQAKRQVLEDEITHLRALVTSLQSNDQNAQNLDRSRILDLETKLRSSQAETSALQNKVALWARASKRNQEARIQAEACQRTLESDIASLKSAMAKSNETYTQEKQQYETNLAQLKTQLEKWKRGELSLCENPNPESTAMLKAQIEELDTMVRERDAKLQEVQEMLMEAQSKIIEFDQTMQEAVNTVDEMERENSSLRTELRLQQMKSDEVVRIALADKEREWEEVQATARDEILRVQREKEDLNKSLKSRDKQIDNLVEKISDFENSYKSLSSKLEGETKRADTFKTKLESVEKDMIKVNAERESAVTALKSLAAPTNGEISDEISPSVAAAAAAANMQLLQEELARERAELASVKQELIAFTDQHQQVAIDALQDKSRVQELHDEVADSKEVIELLQNESQTLRETLQQQETALKSLQSQILDFQRDSNHQQSQIQSLQFLLEEKTNDVEILNSRLASTETRIRSLEDALAQSEENLLIARQQLSDRNAELAAAETTVFEYSQLLDRCKQDLSESERKAVRLERIIKDAAEADATASTDDDDYVGELSMTTVEDHKRKTSARKSLNLGMATELGHLRSQLDAKQELIKSLEEQLRTTKEAMDAVADELRSSTGLIEVLKRRSGRPMSPESQMFVPSHEVDRAYDSVSHKSDSESLLRRPIEDDGGVELDRKLMLQREKISGVKEEKVADNDKEPKDLKAENAELKVKVEVLTKQVGDLKDRLQGIAELRKRMSVMS